MKHILIFFFALIIISCKNNSQENLSTTLKPIDTLKTKNSENQHESISKNKIEIDFKKNKVLLDIILLLPDNSFSSWDWKLEDRIKWYNEIKANNYYIDNKPDFFNQKYFEPNKAEFQIVDGIWKINIYKTFENSYIVITDDIVGDGNSLNFYEVKSNLIKEYLDENTIFSNYKDLLKKKEYIDNCEEKFEEMNDPIFEYDFSNTNKIEIESSWYLTKENYENCLAGNAIIYNFNTKTKKFDIEKIYWKKKKEN